MDNGAHIISIFPEQIVSYLSAFPPWSIAAHLVVCVLVVVLQRAGRSSRQFSSLNEYLCTILWVCWTLESSVIGYASSNLHTMSSLFIRLLLWPSLALDACVNPCNSIYNAVQEKSLRKIPHYIVIQFFAMVTGLLYCGVTWRFLSSGLSATHQGFMTSRASPFLKVSILEGFLLELGMSFVMYLPKLVIRTGFTCNFISAAVTCVMVFLFEHTTGAFMNPIIALSSNLLWHSATFRLGALFVMVVVYWLAPFLGAMLAALLDMWITSAQEKLHVV